MFSRARRADEAARDERVVGGASGAAGRRPGRSRRTPPANRARAGARERTRDRGRWGALGRERRTSVAAGTAPSRCRWSSTSGAEAKRRRKAGRRPEDATRAHRTSGVRNRARPARDAAARTALDARRGVRRRPHPRGGRPAPPRVGHRLRRPRGLPGGAGRASTTVSAPRRSSRASSSSSATPTAGAPASSCSAFA